jgi:hypothetical protein
MTFDSPFLIQRLRDLEQQIVDLPGHAEALGAAIDAHDCLAVIRTKIDTERHLRAMAMTTGHIKAQVLPADGLGGKVASLSELVLRAVRMVMLAELRTLCHLVSGPYARGRSHALFHGPIRTIEDLTCYLHGELHRIAHHWITFQGEHGFERSVYRAVLRAAHASMRQLGTTSGAARVLREGVVRASCRKCARACSLR